MYYTINTMPNFCPGCGKHLTPIWEDKLNRADFLAHAAHTCTCGTHFQYVEQKEMIETAQKVGGDLS